jgi:hypothetical protein
MPYTVILKIVQTDIAKPLLNTHLNILAFKLPWIHCESAISHRTSTDPLLNIHGSNHHIFSQPHPYHRRNWLVISFQVFTKKRWFKMRRRISTPSFWKWRTWSEVHNTFHDNGIGIAGILVKRMAGRSSSQRSHGSFLGCIYQRCELLSLLWPSRFVRTQASGGTAWPDKDNYVCTITVWWIWRTFL